MPVCLPVLLCAQWVPCVLQTETSLKYCRFGLLVPPFMLVLACVGRLWKCDRWSLHLAPLGPPAPSLSGDTEAGDCCHWKRTDQWKGFVLGAIWRTMGEHLVPQGYWHLLAFVDWHKRQHIINFIISPGIVSLCASIFFYPLMVHVPYQIWGYTSVSCLPHWYISVSFLCSIGAPL